LNIDNFIVAELEEYDNLKIEELLDSSEDNRFHIYCKEIDEPQQAVECAEQIWFDNNYGKERIEKQRPYVVKYDKRNEVWIVRGNYESWSGDVLGGIVWAVIRKDGKILGYWIEE